MTVDQFVEKYRKNKLRVRRQGKPGDDGTFVLTREGDELGRYFKGGGTGKWRVLMPRGFGRSEILLPDLLESPAAAIKLILQNHKIEDLR